MHLDNLQEIIVLLVLAWLVIANIVAFAIMYIDKEKAKKGAWRIKEATLFLWAIIGGGLGANLGMQVFRHKTKHWYFVVFMPLILILQIALLVFLYIKFFV